MSKLNKERTLKSCISALILSVVFLATSNCTQPEKHQKHTFLKSHSHRSMAKARSVQSALSAKALNDTITVFTGTVNADSQTPQGNILWKIQSATGKIVQGNQESEFDENSRTFEIHVEGLQNGDKVVFLPYSMANGEKQGSPALYIVGGPSTETKTPVLQKSNRFGKKRKIYQ